MSAHTYKSSHSLGCFSFLFGIVRSASSSTVWRGSEGAFVDSVILIAVSPLRDFL